MWKTEMAGPSDPIGVHELPQRPLPYPPSTGASARRAYFAGAAVLKITRLAPRRPLRTEKYKMCSTASLLGRGNLLRIRLRRSRWWRRVIRRSGVL